MNRRVLRDALATGDTQARVLVGAGASHALASPGGALFDRTA